MLLIIIVEYHVTTSDSHVTTSSRESVLKRTVSVWTQTVVSDNRVKLNKGIYKVNNYVTQALEISPCIIV